MEMYQAKMAKEIDLRGLSLGTRKKYLSDFSRFLDYFQKDPKLVSLEEIKDFIIFYKSQNAIGKKTKRAANTVNGMTSVISFYYHHVLDKNYYSLIPKMKKPKTLPTILSRDEIQLMISELKNVFWKAIIMTLYSTGMRQAELRNLKAHDIDSKRMVINIRKGKGNKDREVVLTQNLLDALRLYWSKHRALLKVDSDFLFIPTKNSHNGNLKKSLSSTAVGYIVKKSAQIAGIKKKLHLIA